MPVAANPFHRALRSSLCVLPTEVLVAIGLTIDELIASTPKTYSIYETLLLLPRHTFASENWTKLYQELEDDQKEGLYSQLALTMQVTHIAINAPIAPTLKNTGRDTENIQRRPDISPLHGNFGPFVAGTPVKEDFANALWVSTRQNGITQVWAPLYTMFSRGNITEKARLLALPSVKVAAEDARGCTAVDLYAGIGYFVFSYAKAGCAKVLGFELNPWSVEGLLRGARANKWSCGVVKAAEFRVDCYVDSDDRVTVFEMSNEVSGDIVEKNRDKLPPVRHVNLGLLPTSRDAYATAVRCLDPSMGGSLHVHANFATQEIPQKAEEVREKMQVLARNIKGSSWITQLEHVEKVKTYAPGVMHCVLDINLLPG